MTENASTSASPGYTCRYCRLSSDASGPACPNCGAPVSTRELRDKNAPKRPPFEKLARKLELD